MRKFCDYLKEADAKCSTCLENGIGSCTIKLGEQDYYKGFQLYDTISIIRHDHDISVETDIEVKYKTKFPYGRFAGKGVQFAIEYADKEKTIRDSLEKQLPIHLHVHKRVEDLDEAKIIADKLANTILPSKLEALIAES